MTSSEEIYEIASENDETKFRSLVTDISVTDYYRRTALHWAAANNHSIACNLLLKLGIDKNLQDKGGQTAVGLAVYWGVTEALQVLLKGGCNTNIANQDGNTPLIIAVKENKVECVRQLIDAGVDINFKNKEGKSAMKEAIDCNVADIVIMLLPLYYVKVDDILAQADDWCELLSKSTLSACDNTIINGLVRLKDSIKDICYVKDAVGKRAIDCARGDIRVQMMKMLIFYGRYEFDEGVAAHQSATCIVKLATDMSDSKHTKKVALKIMKNLDQYKREIYVRTTGNFNAHRVLGILHSYSIDESPLFREALTEYNLQDYPYCIVMEAADRNLKSVIDHERIAGQNWSEIQKITQQIVIALDHVHEREFIHGDIKPLNIMRVGTEWKLIDMDASVNFKTNDYVGAKHSSAYIPPEMLDVTPNGVLIRSYQTCEITGKVVTTGLQYELLKAHPSFDMWALGVTMYQLFTDEPLFLSTGEGNIDDRQLSMLAKWTDEFKRDRLQKVKNLQARILLERLLSKDPLRRPSAHDVLQHPFMTNDPKANIRYDVFLSYRVASEAAMADTLHGTLSAMGLKVYLDKYCLKPGVPWEEGFCMGLVSSDCFVPLLSREAINSSSKDWQNFSKLTELSKCDNVFLEYRLAVELQGFGLVKRIFPIMIGDADGETMLGLTRGNYFRSGCHPSLSTDVCVAAVEAKLREHLDRVGLGEPVKAENSVRSVLNTLTENQGGFVEGLEVDAIGKVANNIFKMVRNLKGDSIRPGHEAVTKAGNRIAKFMKWGLTPMKDKASTLPVEEKQKSNMDKILVNAKEFEDLKSENIHLKAQLQAALTRQDELITQMNVHNSVTKGTSDHLKVVRALIAQRKSELTSSI